MRATRGARKRLEQFEGRGAEEWQPMQALRDLHAIGFAQRALRTSVKGTRHGERAAG